MVSMTPLEERSLGEQIAERIARDIVDGEIAGGSRVSEVELAKRFGTSRSPIRDATRILVAENLVHSSPRRQMIVVPFDHTSVANLYLVRSRLYGLAAASHAVLGQPEAREQLVRAGEDMRRAGDDTDAVAFAAANDEFRDVLFSTCGNPLLHKTLSSLGAITTALLQTRIRAVPGRLRDSGAEHLRAAERIRQRDALGAENAMRGVILGAGRALLVAESADESVLALLDLP